MAMTGLQIKPILRKPTLLRRAPLMRKKPPMRIKGLVGLLGRKY